MKRRMDLKELFLVLLALLLILSLNLVEDKKILIKDHNFDLKYEAARRTALCFEELKRERVRRGIKIDLSHDVHGTGLIGEEFNGITTTLGSLESKRTSTNPNFSAVVVDMLMELGLRAGDNVAINFSSSFPAINISTIVACELLDLQPVIITSIGSSSWGGNNLDFTYLDMEEHLYRKGLIKHKSIAVSPGGAKDVGKDMDEVALEEILERMRTYGKEIIIEEDLASNIAYRLQLYEKAGHDIACFISVGGNLVSFGGVYDKLNTKMGIIREQVYRVDDESGLVYRFLAKGIPVINLLNIKDLSIRYGLEVDADTPYRIGEGGVYYSYLYPNKLILTILVLAITLLIFYRKRILKENDEE